MQHDLFDNIAEKAQVTALPVTSNAASKPVAIDLTPSAVGQVGLDGYAMALARSGRRCVFRQTTVREAMFYDKAIFAVTNTSTGEVLAGTDVLTLWCGGDVHKGGLFVHLLDADQDASLILADLASGF
ncbi:MAG: hypothetical protein OXR62_16640 [Ahrensia sp.]|nr:hypothetical protein [Ahrensia sp.]